MDGKCVGFYQKIYFIGYFLFYTCRCTLLVPVRKPRLILFVGDCSKLPLWSCSLRCVQHLLELRVRGRILFSRREELVLRCFVPLRFHFRIWVERASTCELLLSTAGCDRPCRLVDWGLRLLLPLPLARPLLFLFAFR